MSTDMTPKQAWMIVFEDSDRDNIVITCPVAAETTYRKMLDNWNCHLFEMVQNNGHPVQPNNLIETISKAKEAALAERADANRLAREGVPFRSFQNDIEALMCRERTNQSE